MPIIAFAAAFPLCISIPRATPKIPAAHGRGRGASLPGARTGHRRNNRRDIDGTTEHQRNNGGTSNNLRIRPPRTRGGRGPEGTGKALKPPQPKRKSKFYVFDGTPLPPGPSAWVRPQMQGIQGTAAGTNMALWLSWDAYLFDRAPSQFPTDE